MDLDAQVRKWKRLYTVAGVSAVAFAATALQYEVWAIGLELLGRSTGGVLGLIVSASGVVAILLICSSHLLRLRSRWLHSLYARETARLWRHQIILDGPFLDQILTDRDAHEAAFRQRRAELRYKLEVSDVAFRSFVDEPVARPIHESRLVPQNEAIRKQVLEAQASLRLNYQLGFARRRITRGESIASLSDIAYISEWLATTTLVLAVLATTATFVVRFFIQYHTASVIIGAAGVSLAVLSASIRALRAGLTIPNESTSYAEYASTLHLLDEAYRTAETDGRRWEVLSRVEFAATAELHRFLRAKEGSRFIF